MPCIGKMEPFQPPRPARTVHPQCLGDACACQAAPKATMHHDSLPRMGPPSGFPSCPSCGIHDLNLGPAAGNPGDGQAAAESMQTLPRNGLRKPDRNAPEMAQNASGETLGFLLVSVVSTLGEPQKPSLCCT